MSTTAGIHKGMSFAEYAAIDAANSTMLRKFARSAAHARCYMMEDEADTPALVVGRAVHTAVLEPGEFVGQYVANIPGDGRTKAVKEARAELKADNPNAEILSAADFRTCESVRDAVWDHPTAKELLSGKGFNEVVMVAELQGVLCKARLDRLTEFEGYSCIVDLKTTEDASPGKMAKSMANYGYSTQSSFYLDVTAAVSDVPRKFIHICVEKTAPFAVAVYQLDELALEQGRNDYQRYLAEYKQAKESGLWPGYPSGVQPMELPSWAIKAGEWMEVEV